MPPEAALVVPSGAKPLPKAFGRLSLEFSSFLLSPVSSSESSSSGVVTCFGCESLVASLSLCYLITSF